MTMGLRRRALLGSLIALPALPRLAWAQTRPNLSFRKLAPTPPMGWNSWDSFGATINEEQARANAKIMAEKLKPHGYNIFTVDIQWYEPGATGFNYRAGAPLVMDAFGRLQPAVNRFPSAASGAGFKNLAAYVHSLGLKFGLYFLEVLGVLGDFGADGIFLMKTRGPSVGHVEQDDLAVEMFGQRTNVVQNRPVGRAGVEGDEDAIVHSHLPVVGYCLPVSPAYPPIHVAWHLHDCSRWRRLRFRRPLPVCWA